MARSHPAQNEAADGGTPAEAGVLHELRETVRRYELIFRATNDVLYDLDLEQATVAWNDALYTQYGYSRKDPTDTLEWWVSRVHPDDAFLLENKITDLFDSGKDSWQYDYRFQKADGSYNYVRERGLMLRNKSGRPTRIIGSLLDITAQKQLDNAKDEFISLVSHQLRTPLTVIRVYGEMLTSGMIGSLTEEQAQWVRNMTNSSARLIDVVGTILNVSRLDLGRVKMTVNPCNVIALIWQAIGGVLPLAEEKQVSITFLAPKRFPMVNLDSSVFLEIVHNLLTNAIRYTKPEKGSIEVRLKEQKNGYVVSVKDNGIGIPKEAREHVFERFYRAKNAVNVEVQGSGLGLYLVKVICDAFGGKVWFETARTGTTFFVLIPKTGMVTTPSSKG